ncbi:hypothetical protein M427DRAFT_133498 [Gonapodya prolifera JEL478]|uniref:Uncharacterized protein n=1 Tax=Gonapodya prolifera (strain JEL478) TaxID=1344416 RepID=A0A139AKS0_GONPJ|nr:hypothetical protein M427DRAFT_133498 [Gonapodya prolifera JEL478]|eukprot:KXS17366.1 hypothetical protein M427DRAFT_133498 [Gonapodya prolifera JEL478]
MTMKEESEQGGAQGASESTRRLSVTSTPGKPSLILRLPVPNNFHAASPGTSAPPTTQTYAHSQNTMAHPSPAPLPGQYAAHPTPHIVPQQQQQQLQYSNQPQPLRRQGSGTLPRIAPMRPGRITTLSSM